MTKQPPTLSDTSPTVLLLAVTPSLAAAIQAQSPVLLAEDVRTAESILAAKRAQVVVAEQEGPGGDVLRLFSKVQSRCPEVIRILIGAEPSAESLFPEISGAGLYQYMTRPIHPDSLALAVRNACRLFRLRRDHEQLLAERNRGAARTAPLHRDTGIPRPRAWCLDAIVRGPDSPLEPICDQIARIAPYDIAVLLTGESGTGKELFAQALHESSLRANRPFVAENCGALPDQLLESELFGHRKGAFTDAVADHVGLFEQADGGTVFLDEIGDVSPAFQVKLLRVLQEGEIRPIGSEQRRRVDVRVVAATNRDLEQEMAEGRFRPDLYYRLAGVTLSLPPLRQRPNDLAPICERLLRDAAAAFGTPVQRLSTETLALLGKYAWPGNVRELRNELQRMVVLSDGRPELGPQLLSPKVLARVSLPDGIAPEVATLKERVEALEAGILSETLSRWGWNKSRAAAELGLSRVGLRNKLARYGLDLEASDAGGPP